MLTKNPVWLGTDMLIYHRNSLAKSLFEWKPNISTTIQSSSSSQCIATDNDDCIVVETFGFHSYKVLASEVWG